MVHFLEQIYGARSSLEDTVTVVRFSQIIENPPDFQDRLRGVGRRAELEPHDAVRLGDDRGIVRGTEHEHALASAAAASSRATGSRCADRGSPSGRRPAARRPRGRAPAPRDALALAARELPRAPAGQLGQPDASSAAATAAGSGGRGSGPPARHSRARTGATASAAPAGTKASDRGGRRRAARG
jgi:hypothetical protein